jgi:hypothetical protein
MKKLITLALVSAMALLLLCGCKMGKCDLCGDSGMLTKRSILGTDIYICSDCNN